MDSISPDDIADSPARRGKVLDPIWIVCNFQNPVV